MADYFGPIPSDDTCIIVIPNNIEQPCYVIENGVSRNLADEIDIITVTRNARDRRLKTVDTTKSAITKPLTPNTEDQPTDKFVSDIPAIIKVYNEGRCNQYNCKGKLIYDQSSNSLTCNTCLEVYVTHFSRIVQSIRDGICITCKGELVDTKEQGIVVCGSCSKVHMQY